MCLSKSYKKLSAKKGHPSAAPFVGNTIHSAAHLNKTRLADSMRQVWREKARILIIDETSFLKASDVKKLDEKLKKLLTEMKYM